MESILTANVVILLLLAGIASLAYRLYGQVAFLYLAIAWLFNLLYLTFLNLLPLAQLSRPFSTTEEAVTMVVSLLSTVFFFLASTSLHLRDAQRDRGHIGPPIFWGIAVTLVIVLTMPEIGLIPKEYSLYFGAGAASVFTAIVMIRLGLAFSRAGLQDMIEMLRGSSAGLLTAGHTERAWGLGDSGVRDKELSEPVALAFARSRSLLSLSFILYGVVQLTYLLKYQIGDAMLYLFYFAVVLKLLNGLGMVLYLLGDMRNVADVATSRSILEELGVLSASIEHDIRNPLSHLRLCLDSLKHRYATDKYLLRSLTFMGRQVKRIGTAVDIVPALRETSEYIEERSRVWKLQDLIASAEMAFSDLHETMVRARIDSPDSPLYIRGNRERLQQAVVNLLNNGLEACRARDANAPVEISIRLLMNRELGTAVVLIRDNGIGIPQGIMSKITQPLFSTKDNQNANSGIGLFIAKRIIENHGGSISLESVENEFTEVTINLPSVKGPAPSRKQEREGNV